MELTRIFDLLENLKNYPPKDDILARRVKGVWIKYSTEDYMERSHSVAYGLLALGYAVGTKVITLCNNRPEWNFVDMGVALAHMVHVPVYSTLSPDDYKYIFTHSDAEVIVVGNSTLYKKVMPVVESIDREIKVIMMDDSEDVFCMKQLYELGRANKDKFFSTVEDNKKNIGRDEMASIIYTSGTTGTPKGVMLSHYNIISNSHSHALRQTMRCHNRVVSFLPLCHVYERTMNYDYQEHGISIYYAESLATIASDIKDCHADGFCGVPRVLEMMYGKLESAGANLKGLSRFIYRRAWKFANNYDNYNRRFLYLARHRFFDSMVYSKWRENLGGHEMIVVSGGSSIQARIVRTFNAAKLRIYEGYGMTEASPVIAVNSPMDGVNVIGTVGMPSVGTELSFAEDGEILTRGPHVMLGYYKNPEATAEVIDADGWLHTGDIGTLVDGKYLKITDRKKEIFKLSAGKYVAPQVIENLLKESDFIDNAFVFGENRKFASAIIVPNKAKLKEYALKNKIDISIPVGKTQWAPDDVLLANTQIVKLLHEEVEKVNRKLAPHENVKREHLVLDEWNADNGLLSQTLKPKRKNLLAKYASLVEETYRSE